ncbi:MAG: DUF4012 domain-containing protein [Candidatus Falkowbacteria bacterium]|nr:DUF4012 domain-containing protein [Candidatus Falkowbacteria bacterium]
MKKALRRIIKILKYTLVVLLGLLFLLLLLLGRSFVQFKLFYNETLAGKNSLESALRFVEARNFNGAEAAVKEAETNFSGALDKLTPVRDNWLIKNSGLFNSQVDDLAYLDQSGLLLSQVLGRGLEIARPLNEILSATNNKNFSEYSPADKNKIIKTIYEAEPEIINLKTDLDAAALSLNKIPKFSVLYPVYPKIKDLKDKLKEGQDILDTATPLIRLTPVLMGYPDSSRFLLLLQNNDELRPSGGFLGTYGTLEVNSGEIKNLVTEDTYHLDMPVQDKLSLAPPAVLKKYLKVDKWFLRDANWSPDWPTSARTIQSIYKEELRLLNQPAPDFTGVVAITPDFIADLISLTGPITVKGQTYNKDNFQTLLQYNVEVAYKQDNISSWDRKEIINDIMLELKNRLFNLPLARSRDLLTLLNRNLERKNILVFFNDNNYENLITDLNWSGVVKKAPADYLMVVDANLAAFKSDSVMTKNIAYTVGSSDSKSNLAAELKLFYRHNGGFDWRTTKYRSYTRVYVPKGSKLINISGEEDNTLNVYDDPDLDKTVIAFFMTVEPGAEKEIKINYELPEYIKNLAEAGNYALYIQKQPGRRTNQLTVNLNLRGSLSKYSTDLLTDQSFNLGK